MLQPIVMEGEPLIDIRNLQNLLEVSEKYGFIHEDLVAEVYEAMNTWIMKQPEFYKDYIESAKKEDINVNNLEELKSYIEENDGELFWIWKIEEKKVPEELAMFAAVMFRFIIAESVFGCHKFYVSDFEKYINEIEPEAKEFFDYWFKEKYSKKD
jgi:hypothetical protein